ncbi:hypothetical protein PZH37_09000 [[Eubacterium] siraeum]|nr:hypothetical protein [[Eubacterium] siraeum]
MIFKLNLKMFEGAGGASSGTGDGTGTATSGANEGTSSGANNSKDLSKVVYGKQPTVAENTSSDTQDDAQSRYNEYRNGEGKDFINKEIENAVKRRFKDHSELKKSNGKMQSVMNALSMKYGIDPTDTDGILKAVAEDTTYYETAADEAGMSVEQYKKMKQLEAENAQLQAIRQEEDRRKEFDAKYAEWSMQADFAKNEYPNLDLNTEMQNKDFFGLLTRGIDVKTAYQVIHQDEIVQSAISTATQRTAQAVQQQTVNNIRSKGLRPDESAGSSQAGFTFKADPHKWTKADREEIAKRVARGEKITL